MNFEQNGYPVWCEYWLVNNTSIAPIYQLNFLFLLFGFTKLQKLLFSILTFSNSLAHHWQNIVVILASHSLGMLAKWCGLIMWDFILGFCLLTILMLSIWNVYFRYYCICSHHVTIYVCNVCSYPFITLWDWEREFHNLSVLAFESYRHLKC